jgi:hypothetical protein
MNYSLVVLLILPVVIIGCYIALYNLERDGE